MVTQTTTLPPSLPITPVPGPLESAIRVPGSKSITNRALILAAQSSQTLTLTGALFSRDTWIMIHALRKLGFQIDADEAREQITITGEGGHIPRKEVEIHVGNSGTSARFLTAFLCLDAGGRYTLIGDKAMEARPMVGLTQALDSAGWANFSFHNHYGHIPFTMETRGPAAMAVRLDPSESSQVLSALLMVSPSMPDALVLDSGNTNYRQSYVRLTLSMMEAFGCPSAILDPQTGRIECRPATGLPAAPGSYAVEPDASAASYFLALPIAVPGATICIPGIPASGGLQGDLGFIDVLRRTGLSITWTSEGLRSQRSGQELAGLDVDFYEISDTFLTYAALAPLLPGPVHITGIEHTRRQETDRVAGMAQELQRLGQWVDEAPGALTIHSDLTAVKRLAESSRAVHIHTYEDHRFAMSFGVLGLKSFNSTEPWLVIEDPACSLKTFPSFFSQLATLTS